ncbi:pentapeptide repeat-containing protein [Streptomyces sp. 8N114]|uniref:pentapeptide repeat-containing protein n=1 Tax=Streptomyces sp. 8N114 TaxID=3457419 RepID=UPI003FD391FC
MSSISSKARQTQRTLAEIDAMNTTPPDWEHCGTGAGDADPVGCRGIVIRSTGRCLVHCDDTERQSYLDELSPGADIDLRGTTLGENMLDALLDAVRDTEAELAPRIGDAEFSEVVFTGDARFDRTKFTGDARFDRTKFTGDARFDKATFSDTAWFYETWFTGIAWFPQANFRGDAEFSRAWFNVDARFNKATFGPAVTLGPMTCERTLNFESAVFENSVLIFAAVRYVSCSKARFQEPSTLRLLHAQVDLTDAVLLHPVTVATGSDPYVRRVFERDLPTKMSIRSLRGVDAAMLLISDVDLRNCVFTGTHHLDQLRLEGEWQFATTSEVARWRSGMIPRRRSRRQVIYEERL